MKRALGLGLMLLMLAGLALAKTSATPPFPKTLINARYVFVTSYDGDQFNPSLLPEDRQAIASVQESLQKWGHYILVYRPEEADIVVMVQSRPSEDVLAVYDGKAWPQQPYLWRVMSRGGLQQNETPLVTELRQAVEEASK